MENTRSRSSSDCYKYSYSYSKSSDAKQLDVNNEIEYTKDIRYDYEFHKFVKYIASNSKFEFCIMTITILNSILTGVETGYANNAFVFQFINEIFNGIYTFEFFLKIYAEPFGYFKIPWNWFDFIILLGSYLNLSMNLCYDEQHTDALILVKTIKVFRAFRTLRTVSFVKGLQVIVNALIHTITNSVLNVLVVILLIMFIFAIIGNGFFNGVDWQNLSSSMWTLFRYICADEWPEIQSRINDHKGSIVFTILFVFIGNFIFANIFIGLIIMNISDAQSEYERNLLRDKSNRIQAKKDLIMKRQVEELFKFMQKDKTSAYSMNSFQRLINKYKENVKHENIICKNDLSSNITWIETFIKTLSCFDNTMFALQNLHYENSLVLSSIIEGRLERMENDKCKISNTCITKHVSELSFDNCSILSNK